MSQRHPLAIVAGAATLLAAFPLSTVFASFTWFFYVAVAIIIVVGVAMLARSIRANVPLQVLAMVAALLLFCTLTFPSGLEIAHLIPTAGTFTHFNDLFVAAGNQIRDESTPVPDSDGLLLLTTAGVGLVAILVDVAAVGLRRPALAGLPMLAIYSVPVAVLSTGLSFVPFAFAAAGFLWLLVADSVDRVRRFGRRFTGEGRDVDVWEPSPLSAAGRRLGLAGLAIAVVLPLAVPGMTSGLIDRFGNGFGDGDAPGSGTGAPGAAVNLNVVLKDRLQQTDTFDMVKVTTTDPSPYYLRFGVADEITKDGFANRAPVGGSSVTKGITVVGPTKAVGVKSDQYHATVQGLSFAMNLAPTYDRLAKTEGLDAQWLYDGSTGQVYSRRPGAQITGTSYSFDYVHLSYTPAALRTAGSFEPREAAQTVSSLPKVDYITKTVQDLIRGKLTEYDQVRAIYDSFSSANGFKYSFDATKGDSGSAIVDFLTEKQGYCVQYAAAMAWLVRAAGYPSRVAFGFTRGTSSANNTYILTNKNLHAWTEVFFPNFGWIPFDATPAGSVAGSVQPDWAPDASKPNPEGPGPEEEDRPTGPPVTSSAGPVEGPGPDAGTGTGPAPVSTWWLVTAAVLVLAAFALSAPAWRRGVARRRRRSVSGPLIVITRDGAPAPADIGQVDTVTEPTAVAGARRDAHEAWAELLDTMVDFSVDVDDSETPRATAGRLIGLLSAPAAQDSTRLLARAEERARYALAPLRSEGLNEAVTAARVALALQATRKQRISATLLPRSVLLRWRLGWLTLLSGAVGRAGRIREVMTLASPRRLLTRNRTA